MKDIVSQAILLCCAAGAWGRDKNQAASGQGSSQKKSRLLWMRLFPHSSAVVLHNQALLHANI